MNKYVVATAVAVVGVIATSGLLFAQPNQPGLSRGDVGRYQLHLIPSTSEFLMLDTATGQCWRRSPTGDWFSEGNPTRLKEKSSETAEKKKIPTLKLPEKSLEMTIVQREERAIPGSDGTVRIRLGDITEGQVFMEVFTEDDMLAPRKSVRVGDVVEFLVARRKFTIRVNELRNILIGDDFAKLTIEESDADAAKPTKKKGKKKKDGDDSGAQ